MPKITQKTKKIVKKTKKIKKNKINTFKKNAPFNVRTVKCFYYYNVCGLLFISTSFFIYWVFTVTKGLID
ncbi:hypothetical protein AB205_0053620 [Aquarana catesbeiana]|uniref:Uncharacterized protein n=1 Tax=Aquarana catesbeiana TaxID=8400 RepID=A0A2G9QAR0_AQUCT|nr:hypothetical protein AB205_0053620 [Aquarana catesbeiana]